MSKKQNSRKPHHIAVFGYISTNFGSRVLAQKERLELSKNVALMRV